MFCAPYGRLSGSLLKPGGWTMDRLRRQDVYFTLHATGSILSAKIQDGVVIDETILPRARCPHNWVGALHEMAITDLLCPPSPPGKDLIAGRPLGLLHKCHEDISIPPSTNISASTEIVTNTRPDGHWFPSGAQSWRDNPSRERSQSSSTFAELLSTGTRTLRSPSISTIPPSTAEEVFTFQHSTSSEKGQEEERSAKWSSLRMTKLRRLLDTLRNMPKPAIEEHNSQVYKLANGPNTRHQLPNMPILEFAGVLSDLSNMANTIGFIYGMLSWEIFKREEDRLISEEKISMVLAAKQVCVPN